MPFIFAFSLAFSTASGTISTPKRRRFFVFRGNETYSPGAAVKIDGGVGFAKIGKLDCLFKKTACLKRIDLIKRKGRKHEFHSAKGVGYGIGTVNRLTFVPHYDIVSVAIYVNRKADNFGNLFDDFSASSR